MPNEKLVSSVYFRGSSIGSASLDIIDTSLPATYDISFKEEVVTTIPNAMNVRLGVTTSILVEQNPARPDVSRFWYTLSGDGATKFDLGIQGVTKQPLSGSVSTVTTLVIFTLNLNYYPSLLNIDASLDLYHDSARTKLIASIPIRSLAITGAKLLVTSARNQNNDPEVIPVGIYNNDILVIKYSDNNVTQSKISSIPITTKINNVIVPSGDYPANNGQWINGTWTNSLLRDGSTNICKVTIPRQKNLTVTGDVPITITAGDLSVTNTLIDGITANLIGGVETFDGGAIYQNVDNALPSGSSTLFDSRLSIGYAFVKNTAVGPASSTAGNPPTPVFGPGSDYLSTLITARTYGMKILGKGMELKSASNAVANSKGKATYLAWDSSKLDTAAKRRQFGKYQKTLSGVWKWGVYNGEIGVKEIWSDFTPVTSTSITELNFNLSLVQDPIATSLYGALTSLSFSTLALFVFSTRDMSISGDRFSFTSCVNFRNTTEGFLTYTRDLYSDAITSLPPAVPSNPLDLSFRVDLLFIRNNTRSELNTFENDVPYPRFINVQTKRGYEAYNFTANYATFWDFDLDPALGIDLTNPRYSFITTVQNDSDWGYDFYVPQFVTLVGRSANKVTFRAGWETTNPNLSLAIIDNGPV